MKTSFLHFIIWYISTTLTAQTGLTSAEQRTLNVNQVEALILGRNNKHWYALGNGGYGYRVPKNQLTHAGGANSLWIGGLDNNNFLHIAANTYPQNGVDFWPGPLDTTNGNAYNGNAYNKIWKVDCNDINNFVTAYYNGQVIANTYTVPIDLQNYPAKETGNYMHNMAPFYDANHDGKYNVMDGDYPLIRGHQQVLSIYNDNFASHTETGGLNMGLEIHERSYAYYDPNLPDSMKAVNYTTYYHYEIFNRSNNFYHDVFITDWADIDLGAFDNDLVGSDSINRFAYIYNSGNFDSTAFGAIGYGNKIPVISEALIHTNCSGDGIDNNHNGQIDEPGETFLLDKVTYYNNNLPGFNINTINPATALHYYNYMAGKWKDNSHFKHTGNAYAPNNTLVANANFVFDGDPQIQNGWTEGTAGNLPGDRRFLISSRPFTFPPNSKIEWGYAKVFSRDTIVANTINLFNIVVRRDVKNAILYDKLHNTPQCAPYVIGVSVKEWENDLKFTIYPNPGKDKINLVFNKNMNEAKITVSTILGQTIKSQVLDYGSETSIYVQELQTGIYFITIEHDNAKHTIKWIKQD